MARNMVNMGSVMSAISQYKSTQAATSYHQARSQSQMGMASSQHEQPYNTISENNDEHAGGFKQRKRMSLNPAGLNPINP